MATTSPSCSSRDTTGQCVQSIGAEDGRRLDAWSTTLDAGLPTTFGAIPVVGAIRRMPWDHSDATFNEKMMARLTPVILTGSPVERWDAVHTWTPDVVASRVGLDGLIYATHSSDGNFLFHSEFKAKTADPSYAPPNKCVALF